MSQETAVASPAAEAQPNTATNGTPAPDNPVAAPAPGTEGFQSLIAQAAAGTTREAGAEVSKAATSEGDAKTAEQAKTDDPAAKVPATPQDYALSFGEGVQVDKELLTGFQAQAHELGLQQGQAQKLAALYEQHTKAAQERQVDAWRQAVKGWEQEITSSKTYAADAGNVKLALAKFGSPEFNGQDGQGGILNETLLGSHPVMWRFLADVGKQLAEPGFQANGVGATKSAAEVLYPSQNK